MLFYVSNKYKIELFNGRVVVTSYNKFNRSPVRTLDKESGSTLKTAANALAAADITDKEFEKQIDALCAIYFN